MKQSTRTKVGLLMLLIFILACENAEEKQDVGLVGKWYRVYKTIDDVPYGLAAIVYLNSDGTGMSDEILVPGDEEYAHFNFTWETADSIITVKDENDSTVWTARYSLRGDQKVVKFSGSSGDRSSEEMYVKYSGDKDVNLVGNWVLAKQTVNAERAYKLQLTKFFTDGTGETYSIGAYQINDLFDLQYDTTQDFETFDWSTTADYVIITPNQGSQPNRIAQYAIANEQLDATIINESSEIEVYIFIRDDGGIDETCLGTWSLSSVKVGDFSPYNLSGFALELNEDSTGVWSYGSKGGEFQWSANGGYIFIYVKQLDNFLNIALVQSYQIDDQGLKQALEEYRGDVWIRVEYSFVKTG
jgi:hypothetical protein